MKERNEDQVWEDCARPSPPRPQTDRKGEGKRREKDPANTPGGDLFFGDRRGAVPQNGGRAAVATCSGLELRVRVSLRIKYRRGLAFSGRSSCCVELPPGIR